MATFLSCSIPVAMFLSLDALVYVWGGSYEDTSTVHCFDSLSETWFQKEYSGLPPPGLVNGACATVGHHLYVYGGQDEQNDFHSSLHQLDFRTNTWMMISNDGPRRKGGCGLVSFDSSEHLLLIGGYGDAGGYTDKIHSFDLKEGEEGWNYIYNHWTELLDWTTRLKVFFLGDAHVCKLHKKGP